MMDDIKSNIKVWFDDYLLHTKTEDVLLATLKFIFKQCQKNGLKLHDSKCVLFATMVWYCGRFITKDGVRYNPKNKEALQEMGEPQNGAVGTVCRGSNLDANPDIKLLEACGPTLYSTGEIIRG
jgi:hypothetical protein